MVLDLPIVYSESQNGVVTLFSTLYKHSCSDLAAVSVVFANFCSLSFNEDVCSLLPIHENVRKWKDVQINISVLLSTLHRVYRNAERWIFGKKRHFCSKPTWWHEKKNIKSTKMFCILSYSEPTEMLRIDFFIKKRLVSSKLTWGNENKIAQINNIVLFVGLHRAYINFEMWLIW